ncbi:hypothetical protein [Streptomyces melanogenes]|uniref:hypothetical protein n=1 Tax=Streptomyces melanogenes TaxID=67326 RepID=UPI00167CF474|nr:hypothetical protein [Streptomyces melanogenes]GGP80888.1 hypothetical protein GCM10010278_69300 [Streptomyces melanogenes]
MRWLMALGERTRPDTPTFAECPGPHEARAVALVDDAGQLFAILLEWRRLFGNDLTGWASQVEADDIENLPLDVIENWGPDQLRLDTMPGGYVKVSDYRDHQALAALPTRNNVLMRP